MTAHRLQQYERILSRLRPRVWGADGDRVQAIIGRVKRHCAAAWHVRTRQAARMGDVYLETLMGTGR